MMGARLNDETKRFRRSNPLFGVFEHLRAHGIGRGARREMTAFVLAGGGSRGAVQVGMLSELVARGIHADRVYGASVGAVNAAAYSGDPTPKGIEDLENVWRNLKGAEVFPRSRLGGPWMLLQQRESVHANTGLRKLIEDGLKFENIEDSAVPLEVVATSLTDGAERWISRGPAVDALLASAAIPAIFPPIRLNDELLIDGGVVNNVPIRRALDAGATRIYVLLCGPLNYRPPAPRRPVEAVLTAFFVAVHARFVRELATVDPDVDVIVFTGGGEPSGAYRDFSATPELIAEGKAQVARVLDRLAAQAGTATDSSEPTPDRSAPDELGMATA
ncbi:MAG: patatin-like phospholipase family protein [Acidimicrobiales bacterium]|jgi:NTE family protein